MVSEKTQSKARYWAERLECPVDEDAGYRNTFVSKPRIRVSLLLQWLSRVG